MQHACLSLDYSQDIGWFGHARHTLFLSILALGAKKNKKKRRRKMLINYTYMLLSVRQDLPEAREKLDPGPFSQRCGDVTELNQGV